MMIRNSCNRSHCLFGFIWQGLLLLSLLLLLGGDVGVGVVVVSAAGDDGDDCSDKETVLHFESATVTTSTLQNDGGELRFNNVGTYYGDDGDDKIPIDLVVKQVPGATAYTPKKATQNRLNGYYGMINVKSQDGEGTFQFCFMNSQNQQTIILDSFFFSFYDMDSAGNDESGPKGYQVITLHSDTFTDSYTTANTEIEKSNLDGGFVQFKATESGWGDDNPEDPNNLTPLQQNQSVVFKMEHKDCFIVKLSIDCSGATCGGGRNFLFAGRADQLLPTCPAKTKAPINNNNNYTGGTAKTNSGGVSGDPHFKTWAGVKYDYHGRCDLVLLSNPNFNRGLGMEIHIRSKKTKNWSYISTAVIRIGGETFEVAGMRDGNSHWLNMVEVDDAAAAAAWGGEGETTANNNGVSISGYRIRYKKENNKHRRYTIDLENLESIQIKTWKDMVRVDINNNPSSTSKNSIFSGSLGLMGSYPDGIMYGRDGTTVFNGELNDFGQEWQVMEQEPKIFRVEKDGPQSPEMCEAPTKKIMRRSLAASIVTREDAALSCSHSSKEEFDLCVFDVMAIGSTDVATGAY